MNDIRTAWVDVVHFSFRWLVVLGVCLPGLAARSGRAQEAMGPKLEVERVLGNTTFRHADDVTVLVPLADGQWLLSAARDATVRLWEIETGRELKRYRHAYMGEVWDVILRPGKDEFFSCGSSGMIIHWDLNRGEKLKEYDPPEDVQVDCLAVTPDGQRLIAGDRSGAITVWDVETGKMLARLAGHNGNVHAICLAADGKRLYSGGTDGKMLIWDLEKYEAMTTLRPDGAAVVAIEFAPDGEQLAVVTCRGHQKHTIFILRPDGTPVARWHNPFLRHSVAWAPDSRRVAAAGSFGSYIADVRESTEPLKEVRANTSVTKQYDVVGWGTDPRRIFVSTGCIIVHLDVEKKVNLHRERDEAIVDFRDAIENPVYSPRTGWLYFDVGSANSYLRINTTMESRPSRKYTKEVIHRLACSPDGKTLVGANQAFYAIEASSGKVTRTWKNEEWGDLIHLAFTSPRQVVAVRPLSATPVELWDIETGTAVARLSPPPRIVDLREDPEVPMVDTALPKIRQAESSADGRHLLTVDEQETVLVWDLGQQTVRERIVHPLEQKIEHVALGGPDGRWVALAANRKVFFYLPPADEAPTRTAEWLKEKIPHLGAATFQERRQAQQDIIAAGPSILPLMKDLQSDDPEIAARLREIREALSQQGRDRVIQATLNLRMPCRDFVFLDDIHWAAIENYGADSVVVLGAIRDGKAVVLDRLSHEYGPEKLVRHSGDVIITGNGNGTISRLRIVK